MMAACKTVSLATPIGSLRPRKCGASNSGSFCGISFTAASPPCVQSLRDVDFHPRADEGCRNQSVGRPQGWSMPSSSRKSCLSAPKNRLDFSSHSASAECRWKKIQPSASSSAGEVSVTSTSGPKEQREELKQKLLASIQAAEGNLNEECVGFINELAKLNPNVGVLEGEEGRKLWVGAFEGVKASFKGSGKKGGGKSEVGYKGAPATLGRLSFNSFKPADLDVFFTDFLNEVYEKPEAGYLLITCFNFENPRGPDLPPVEGIIFSSASYSNVAPDRQEVVFQSSVVRPRFPEKDLEVWKEVFSANEKMDEQGQVCATLPDYKGTLDFAYIDEELRITKGNFGSYVVVRKLPELKPEFRS